MRKKEGRGENLEPGRPFSNYSMVSFDMEVTPNFEGSRALLPFQDVIKFGECLSSKAVPMACSEIPCPNRDFVISP